MKQTFYSLTLLCFAACNMSAQSFAWANQKLGYAEPKAVISYSNTILEVGSQAGTVDFDPSAATYSTTAPLGAPYGYIASYQANGTFNTAKNISVTGGSCTITAVGVDSNKDIYVTGKFSGTADFDLSALTANALAAGSTDIFIAKYDANFNYLWHRVIGGTGADEATALTIDATDQIYVTGGFSGTADFDPSAGVNNLVSAGQMDIFVLKLNLSGAALWARRIGNTVNELGTAITVDGSANVTVGGEFTGTIDFDPGAGLAQLTTTGGNTDGFLVQLNASGNYNWANALQSAQNDKVVRLATDNLNRIYVLENHKDGYNFGAVNMPYNFPGSSFPNDIGLIQLSQAGTPQWGINIGGSSEDLAADLKVDANGNAYLTGSFVGVSDFDGSAATMTLSCGYANAYNAFVAKYNNLGGLQYAKLIRNNSVNVGVTASAICYNSANQYVYSTGGFFTPAFPSNMDYNSDGGGTVTPIIANGYYSYLHAIGSCAAPAAPVAGSAPAALCAGESATLSASASGTLNWYSTANGGTSVATGSLYVTPAITAAGTYTYYAEAQTCTVSPVRTAITVTVNGVPSVSVTSAAALICPGASVSLTASGANTYTWSGGATGASATYTLTGTTTYTVTGENSAGCRNTASYTQSVSPAISLSVSSSTTSLCSGQSATLTANASNASTYSWSNGATTPAIVVSPTVTSSYTVTASNSIGCTKTQTLTQAVTTCTSTSTTLTGQVDAKSWTAYPNPASDLMTVSLNQGFTSGEAVSIELLNALGQTVWSETSTKAEIQVSIGHLDQGLYLLRVSQGNRSSTQKVIKHL